MTPAAAPMVPKLLVLALEFHRAPLSFSHLTDPARPLPEAFGHWLAAASKALAPGEIEATAEVLDTQPEVLREAFLFFIRQTLLSPQADHYRILGLSRGSSEASIKRNYSLLVRLFHPDRVADETERNSRLTARINSAYQALCDPQMREHYDLHLPPVPDDDQTWNCVPDFFQPREPDPEFDVFARSPPALSNRLRWVITWLLAAVVIILLVL